MPGLGRVLLLISVFCLAHAGKRHPLARRGEEDWGYVEVRPGAHLFYWLYYTSGANDPATLPLVLWLQGGPGSSSTAYGNFEIIGPVDMNFQARDSSWVHHVNVLFIDNPVGTGYSHVDNVTLLTKNNKEIADDLVTFTKQFYQSHPEFETTPLYIFGESYGGKMDVEFALELDKAIKAGELKANLKSVAIGDGWVSPIDSVTSWASYLLQTGIVDTEGYTAIDESAQLAQKAVDEGRWKDATDLWAEASNNVTIYTHNVDFYNILEHTKPVSDIKLARDAFDFAFFRSLATSDQRKKHMTGPIRDKLRTRVPNLFDWGEQKEDVFRALWYDFMKPATDVVEQLLNTTDLDVVVYNGHLDLIVSTPGQVKWVERLRWPGKSQYMAARREPVTIDGYTEGYLKKSGHLSFWWINRAGHMVPTDNAEMGVKLVRAVCGLPPIN